MNNTKHRVVLRESPLNNGSDEERVIEIETVEQLKNKISSSPNEMHLYLGGYNLGEIVAYEGEYIGFEGLLSGNMSDLYMEFSPLYIHKNALEKIINCDISLEELLNIVWSEYAQYEIVSDKNRAWELLQNHWLPRIVIKDIIDSRLADEETIKNENRIIFWK